MGELQEKILKHFFECQSKQIEGVNHISEAVGASQPSVSRSMDHLLENKYLQEDPKLAREKGHKFFEKPLYVTDKGAAYSVVNLRISLEQIKSYNKKYDRTSEDVWNQYYKIFLIPEKREYIFRKTMEFLLMNNIFDNEGRIRNQLTEEEILKMKVSEFTASKEYYEAAGLYSQRTSNINEFIDRYKIDRNKFREHLLLKKEEIDSALKQIDDPSPTSKS
jgi:hypothetical protein